MHRDRPGKRCRGLTVFGSHLQISWRASPVELLTVACKHHMGAHMGSQLCERMTRTHAGRCREAWMTGQRLTCFSPLLLPPLTRRREHTTNRVRLHLDLRSAVVGILANSPHRLDPLQISWRSSPVELLTVACKRDESSLPTPAGTAGGCASDMASDERGRRRSTRCRSCS